MANIIIKPTAGLPQGTLLSPIFYHFKPTCIHNWKCEVCGSASIIIRLQQRDVERLRYSVSINSPLINIRKDGNNLILYAIQSTRKKLLLHTLRRTHGYCRMSNLVRMMYWTFV